MNAELTFRRWLKLRGVATADGSPVAPNSSDVLISRGWRWAVRRFKLMAMVAMVWWLSTG